MRVPIIKANGSLFLRPYTTVKLNKDGEEVSVIEQGTVLLQGDKPKRKKFAFKIGRIPEGQAKFPVSTILRNNPRLMAELSRIQDEIKTAEAQLGGSDERPDGDYTVARFYNQIYLPHIRESKTAKTLEYIAGYWASYLKEHFNETRTLRNYEAFIGTTLLETLCRTKSQNTVSHVRSVASGIFAYAVAKGYLRANPWRDVKQTSRAAKKAEDGYAYSLQEVELFMDALDKFTDESEFSRETAQMALALGFYAGLRPSEIVALKKDAVTDESIVVRAAYSGGQLKGTKTGKIRTVPLVPQLQRLLKLWWAKRPAGEWVLPNQSGNLLDIDDLGSKVVAPAAKRAGLEWKGWYPARRGFGTALMHSGASCEAIAQAMGNSPAVVWKNYFKDTKGRLAADAMKKFAATLSGNKSNAPALSAGEEK